MYEGTEYVITNIYVLVLDLPGDVACFFINKFCQSHQYYLSVILNKSELY